jgi:hypothetical protein
MKQRRDPYTSPVNVHDEEILNMKDVGGILQCSSNKAGESYATGRIVDAFRVGCMLRSQAVDLRKHIKSEKLPKNREHLELLERLAGPRRPDRRRDHVERDLGIREITALRRRDIIPF